MTAPLRWKDVTGVSKYVDLSSPRDLCNEIVYAVDRFAGGLYTLEVNL